MIGKFLKEFREFAERGSAIDMAVGVIAGAAMNSVVNSLVKDVIMPPIGLLLGNTDMSDIAISLGNTKIGIGLFMNSLVSFILTMFAVFLFIKMVNNFRTAKSATTRECPYCFTNISVKATKCPNCCADVVPVDAPLAPEAGIDKLIKDINPIKKLGVIRKKIKKIVK